MVGTPLYAVWRGIVQRCLNPNCASWHRYGGRGIKLCRRWRVFDHFMADVGQHPGKGWSIERVNVNGDYKPGNVTWIETTRQARNRQNQRFTLATARMIRRLRAQGWTYQRLADRFGQSTGNMHAIVNNTRWKE